MPRGQYDYSRPDQAGNSVIVELKRQAGSLGVETQTLQYLADFSAFKGRDFLARKIVQRADAVAETALTVYRAGKSSEGG
jgi:hypothetical protein